MTENRLPMEATGGAASRKPGRPPPVVAGKKQKQKNLILFLLISRRTVYGMVVWIVGRIYWIAGQYASEHGGADAEGQSPIKNAGHSAGGAGPPAGGVHDNESATV